MDATIRPMSAQIRIKAEETQKAVALMQSFKATSLVREAELGAALNFVDVVAPAESVIGLYKQIPIETIPLLSHKRINALSDKAREDKGKFDAVLSFNPEQAQPRTERDRLVAEISGMYDSTFEALHPVIAFVRSHALDIQAIKAEARAAVEPFSALTTTAKKDLEDLHNAMQQRKVEADGLLATMKNLAANQGVAHQAQHFEAEATAHDTASVKWLTCTFFLAICLTCFAVGSLFLHKVEGLTPATTYETIQLGVSKTMIFATLSFLVLTAARNYISHRHNAVVNRHRHNALLTFNSLVKAAEDKARGDIVLEKAASCIFAPQPTGYSKGDAGDGGAYSIVSVAPGAVKGNVSS
ncbi:MAG: hypothetical protein JNK76_23275 [Planctomycetales bacterium]|nr:hypothetical protein [Planctomycetales bacterium]